MARNRKSITLAEKLRYISMAIEDCARMRAQYDKKFKPRTSLVGYACQFTSNPKLKPEDFEPMLNMSLREIILSEIDFPLTTEEFKMQKQAERRKKRVAECVSLEMRFDGQSFIGYEDYNSDFNVHHTELMCSTDEQWEKIMSQMREELERRKANAKPTIE